MPDIDLAECFFYHTVELPGHGLVVGPWDLRGTEADYVGHVDLAGKRVLELGPASGGLTLYMERSGAEVTCLETSQQRSIDIMPRPGIDMAANEEAGRLTLRRVNNAWLATKAACGLRATMEYGDLNERPETAGTHHVALVGAILLHCRAPLSVLERACVAATETVIVTELLAVGLEGAGDSLMRFDPTRGAVLVHWWSFSPGAIADMLGMFGFTDCRVSFHDQMARLSVDPGATFQPVKMFTVVGRRPA